MEAFLSLLVESVVRMDQGLQDPLSLSSAAAAITAVQLSLSSHLWSLQRNNQNMNIN